MPSHPAALWPIAEPLTTPRLRLEPLRVDHAPEAARLLDDVRLHRWTGGSPRTPEELEAVYRRQSAGRSPDGSQGWLNWMLRCTADSRLVGTVQATLHRRGEAPGFEADLAWVVGTAHQGNGYAREAAHTMAAWLRTHGATRLTAHVHPDHQASAAVARSLGMTPTDDTHDGELRWTDFGC